MIRVMPISLDAVWTLGAAVPANSKSSLLLDSQRQHRSKSRNTVLAPMIPCRRR
jgi:hypothetical protein